MANEERIVPLGDPGETYGAVQRRRRKTVVKRPQVVAETSQWQANREPEDAPQRPGPGRPKKAESQAPHHKTLKSQRDHALKLKAIMTVIKEHYSSMRGFLRQFFKNESFKVAHQNFYEEGGFHEILGLWLNSEFVRGRNMVPSLVEYVKAYFEDEFHHMLKDKGSVVRFNSRGQTQTPSKGTLSKGEELSNQFPRMSKHVKTEAPLVWRVLKKCASKEGDPERWRSRTDTVALSSILSLLYSRNQQANAWQSTFSIFYYASGLQRSGMDVLNELGMCVSYLTFNNLAHALSNQMRSELMELAAKAPMLMELNNVNKHVGVRDGSLANQSYMSNSTGGFATPVGGLPANFTGNMLPRRWYKRSARRDLIGPDMIPEDRSVNVYEDLLRFEICETLSAMLPDELKNWFKGVRGGKYGVPTVELVDATKAVIYSLDLMDFEQMTIAGNLKSVKHVLEHNFAYSLDYLIKCLVLCGGDQLFVERMRQIQRMRESDVAGENYQYIVTLLGTLHLMMNLGKLIMKQHYGGLDSNDPSRLRFFNTLLGAK